MKKHPLKHVIFTLMSFIFMNSAHAGECKVIVSNFKGSLGIHQYSSQKEVIPFDIYTTKVRKEEFKKLDSTTIAGCPKSIVVVGDNEDSTGYIYKLAEFDKNKSECTYSKDVIYEYAEQAGDISFLKEVIICNDINWSTVETLSSD